MQLEKTAAGAARVALHQIKFLKKAGWDVHVFGDRINKQFILDAGGTPHKAWLWKGTGYLRRRLFGWQAKRLAKKLGANLVIGHGDLAEQDVLCLHNCVHFASEQIHGIPLSQKSEMYKTHTPQLRDRKFKHLIANSELMKKDLVERFHIPASQITVAYPAVNLEKFSPVTDKERTNIRNLLSVNEDKFVLGLVTSGNFKKRGLDLFLAALELLPAEDKARIVVWLVGKDHVSTNGTVPIHHLPVRTDVENYFRALDLFVLPARIEEFGLVVAEAMACGAPILVGKNVGAAELWDDPSQVTTELEPSELSHRISQLINDEKRRSELSKAGLGFAARASEEATEVVYREIFFPIAK